MYRVTILSDDAETAVQALSLSDDGNQPLAVELLAAHLLTLEMTDGGEVTIESLQVNYSPPLHRSCFSGITAL